MNPTHSSHSQAAHVREAEQGRLRRLLECADTPAFVIDEVTIAQRLQIVDLVKKACGVKFLYTLKPLADAAVMRLMVPHVDGFSASSLFEARLARDVLRNRGTVHVTTPGFRPDEIEMLAEACDYVTLNSLPQLERYRDLLRGRTHVGLRVNPKLSFADDERYDPCRRSSKLGVPIEQLTGAADRARDSLRDVTGLHLHNNCDAKRFQPLLKTVRRIMAKLPALLRRIEWLNMGGGYLFDSVRELPQFYRAVELIRSAHDIDVFVEPGAALVREAGYLVSSVIDLFESDDATVAVLDTTVNHMPEVYEYQFEPDVLGHDDDAEFEYVLAGSSCLAGDVFGVYGFAEPLRVGSRIAFANVGAYTQVKAHMFNGINLPALYRLAASGELVLRKRFTFEDFLTRVGE
jgi:carboxynorspermidine decarboxylase